MQGTDIKVSLAASRYKHAGANHMTEATSSPNLLQLVHSTVELPTMPEVLVKLNEVMATPGISAADVAAVVAADPAVAANVLRIVNSAHYGLQARVSSVSLAVSLMGFATTKKVALKAAVFSAFAQHLEGDQHFDPSVFWRHAIYTGVAARALAQASPVFSDVHPEDAYIAGLLHDIGKIILMDKAGPGYAAMLRKSAERGIPEVEVEGEDFGFTHADVGSVLAIKWSLPEDLAIAIRSHHAPLRDFANCPLSSLVHVADRLAWCANEPSTVETPQAPFDEGVYEHLGLSPDQVQGLTPHIAAAFEASEMPW